MLEFTENILRYYALFDAFNENQENFEHIDILCRIYETTKEELSVSIAEYTNSQNPVQSRDIRSNDFTQKKLEKELLTLGYYYERKKGQYSGRPKAKRIDAEKAGQALLAFFSKLPAEAKNHKKIIFAEKYEEVFSDNVTADSVLIVMKLFNEIESKKMKKKSRIMSDPKIYDEEAFILFSTHYILYAISQLADRQKLAKTQDNYSELIGMYDKAVELIKRAVSDERSKNENREKYLHGVFFKSNKPKIFIQKYLDEGE